MMPPPKFPHDEAGGPAFPLNGEASQAYGMSLLDFFAAFAPAEIPPWMDFFEENSPKPPLIALQALERQPAWRELPDSDKTDAIWWVSGRSEDDEPPPASYGLCEAAKKEIEASIKRFEEESREASARRYFAWRWHYARQMLASRG